MSVTRTKLEINRADNDKTDEAQVKLTFVRNEGKTTKFFLYYALNDKRAVVIMFSCNTQKIPWKLTFGADFPACFVHPDGRLFCHTTNHLWFTGTGNSFFRRFEISTALLSFHCWPQFTIRTCKPLHNVSLHTSCRAHPMQVFMTIKTCN